MRDNQYRRPSEAEIEAARATAREQRNNPERQALRQASQGYDYIKSEFRNTHNPRGILAQQIIARRILAAEPLQFAAFYGVGNKAHIDDSDLNWLNNLSTFSQAAAAVAQHSYGSQIHLLFADVHGRFNGFIGHDGRGEQYLLEVQAAAESRGMQIDWMSNWYQDYGITLPQDPYDISAETTQLFAARDGHKVHLAKQLVESASRHHANGFTPQEAAQYYLEMRLRERNALNALHGDKIMIINGGKANLALLNQDMAMAFTGGPGPWFANR